MSGSNAMKKVPTEAFRRQFLAILPVFLNMFMIGSTNGWISNAIYFFQKGDPQAFTISECSMIASSSEMGRMIFSIPAGFVADIVGRKLMTISAGVVHFVSWIMLSFFSSYIPILVARFGLGTASALVNSVCLITIGEISSPEIRAKMSGFYQVFYNFGSLFEGIVTILFPSYFSLSYSTTIISALYFISLYWLLETPHFLVSRSRYDEARTNLKAIRIGYSESEIDYEFANFKKYIEDEQKRKKELLWLKFISSKVILKPFLTILIINFSVQFLGALVIVSYVTKFAPDIEMLPKKYYPFLCQLTRITASLTTPFFIEKFPRRITFLSSTLFMLFDLTILGVTYYCFTVLSVPFCRWIFLLAILCGTAMIGCLVQPMNCTMKTELLPQAIKGCGGSICVMAQSFANVLSFQVYNVVANNYEVYYVFFIFATNAFILFLLIYFLLPETRGKFLADIQTTSEEKGNSGDIKENYLVK